MLYSKNGAYPESLPHRITLANGLTRTDPSTFTAEEIRDAGYVAVSNPPACEYPNQLVWDGQEWSIRLPNDEEIAKAWSRIRSQRNIKLEASDVYILKAYEAGTPVAAEIIQYRQALRDITKQESPWKITWPTLVLNTEGT